MCQSWCTRLLTLEAVTDEAGRKTARDAQVMSQTDVDGNVWTTEAKTIEAGTRAEGKKGQRCHPSGDKRSRRRFSFRRWGVPQSHE